MNLQETPIPKSHVVRLDTVPRRIRAVRKARHMTVGEAARVAGVSRTSFSNWESGTVKMPDTRGLGAFCKAADVSLDWLLEDKGPPPEVLGPKREHAPVMARGDYVLLDLSRPIFTEPGLYLIVDGAMAYRQHLDEANRDSVSGQIIGRIMAALRPL